MTVGADGIIHLMPFARTAGLEPALGAELTLYWIEGYGGGVFLPFRDATSGRSTYAGGRYLLDTIKGADLGTTDAGDRSRLQLRLQSLLRLFGAMDLSAAAGRKHPAARGRGRRTQLRALRAAHRLDGVR